jgi:hypothetical protein
MRLLLALGTLVPLLAAENPREIVRSWVQAEERNQKLSRNYTFIERSDTRRWDGDGKLKRSELRTYDITLTEGTPYRRLIAIDDKPLPADMERREQEKLRASIEERSKESPGQRNKRIAEWEKRREKQRAFLDEVSDAMDFRLAGEQEIHGRKALVIEATPRPGYEPKSRDAKFLPKLRGRVWIDQQDRIAARMEAEVIDDLSFGVFLAKVNKGAHFELDQARVSDEVWLPSHVTGSLAARIVWSRLRETFDITYRDFRKFQAESRIVSTEEAPVR